MTAPPRTVQLIEVATGTGVSATLRRHLAPGELVAIERAFGPERDRLVTDQRRSGRDRVTTHAHWTWDRPGKTRAVADGSGLATCVEYGGQPQAAMLVLSAPQPSRSWWPALGPWLRRPVLYIDYLEAAPWNNADLTAPAQPRYKLAGTHLLLDAVRLSSDLGLGGRVGLHSLPAAVDFYRRRGMRVVIRADWRKEGLPYLEYNERAARTALDRLGGGS